MSQKISQSASAWALVGKREVYASDPRFGGMSVNPRIAIKAAIAFCKAQGIQTLRLPGGTWALDTNSEATAILIDFPLRVIGDAGCILSSSYYDLSTLNFVGVTGGAVENIDFRFTGTRPGSAAGLTSSHFGYVGTGVESPPNFAAHVSVLGCNNITLRNLRFYSDATTHRKECAIHLSGGTATGPNLGTSGTTNAPGAGAVYSKGIRISECEIDDVYFGIVGLMLDRLQVADISFGRYFPDAFVGPGHAVYITGHTKNSRFCNIGDAGEFVDNPGSGTNVGALSFQFRSLNSSILSGLKSSRTEGLFALLNNSNDNTVSELHWSADRVPYETGLTNTAVWIVAQTDSTSTQNRNVISNLFIEDRFNAGAARSANCPIMGNSGATVVSANMSNNVVSDATVVFYPDTAFGKGVIYWPGVNSTFQVTLCNLGTGITRSGVQLTGSAAGTLAKNEVHINFTGNALTTYNLAVTNSAGSNNIYIHGAGLLMPQGAIGAAAGDRIMCDDQSYSQRADLVGTHSAHKFVHTLTTSPTIPVPSAELTYLGSKLTFTFIQDATGSRVITWNAVFNKAADGAGTGSQRGSTVFEYDGAKWVQIGGALTFRT